MQTVKEIDNPLGSSRLPPVSAKLFEDTYDVKDYIISFGRIEVRKNQGLLLKALQDVDLPVVLVAGKMSYNPDYESCIRGYRRKGKTLVVNNLTPELLASAYSGTRVHALPSWYELPGLVSLESAICRASVVYCTYGTIRSYFKDLIHYCEPDCVDSIKSSILNAFETRAKPELAEKASQFTWENTGKRLLEIYDLALSRSNKTFL